MLMREGDLTEFYAQRPRWRTAGDRVLAGLEVTEVKVPLDYREPDRRTITIAMARRPATDRARRLGVLMIPPDDPGNRGMVLIPQLVTTLPVEVLERYDLVAFDHRFAGASTPIQCDLAPAEGLWVFHAPETFESEIRFQAGIAAKVAEAGLDLLPYASTRNIARDMDVIRAALGEESISYLGYSYGTYLGAVYAQMFGDRVDRMVLDSVLSPDWVWRGLFFNVASTVEASLTRWTRWASSRDGELHLGTTPQQVRERYDDLLRTARKSPFMVSGLPMPVDEFGLRLFTVVFLSYDRTYPRLGDLLRACAQGRALEQETPATLMRLLSLRDESNPAGQLALLCGEWSWPRRLEVYEHDMEVLGKEFPFIGRTLGAVKAGAFWPTSPVEPVTEIGPGGAASALLVQAEHDVFTGSAGARRLRELLPDSSRLVLAADTAHHRLFPFADNPDVNEVTAAYLLEGRLPEADVTCANAVRW
jgi:pimeloyl-ACP methyl ester carboxylesterase